jgi:hypothetical protein
MVANLPRARARIDYLTGNCGARVGGRSCGPTIERRAPMSATTAVPAGALDLVRLIRADAMLSGAAGAALLLGSPWLDGLLGAPTAFLAPLGVFLLAYAGALVLLARAGAPRAGAAAVVVGNVAWVAASVVVVLADTLTLTTAGTVFTLAQAAAVLVLADLQLIALRRGK